MVWDAAGRRRSEGRSAEGVYPETSWVGDCFGSLGPAAWKVGNPSEAESVQVSTIPKLEGARESDRPTGQELQRRNRG